MDRTAAVLLSLVLLAAAALVVGASGWVLFVRGHRAASAPTHHPLAEES